MSRIALLAGGGAHLQAAMLAAAHLAAQPRRSPSKDEVVMVEVEKRLLSPPVQEPLGRQRRRERRMAMSATAMLGLAFGGSTSDDWDKQARKCLLPDCHMTTTHNGGYCSAAHCKLHRLQLKARKST